MTFRARESEMPLFNPGDTFESAPINTYIVCDGLHSDEVELPDGWLPRLVMQRGVWVQVHLCNDCAGLQRLSEEMRHRNP